MKNELAPIRYDRNYNNLVEILHQAEDELAIRDQLLWDLLEIVVDN